MNAAIARLLPRTVVADLDTLISIAIYYGAGLLFRSRF